MAKQRNHLYEGMYILSATLSDDARQKALEKINNGITGRGGEINGRREGHYFILYFSAPTKNLSEMWKEYHLNEDLVRFLTSRTPVVPEKIEFKQLLQE
jgi:small subunit ribosomal protein S6